jgi:hypothetical protein
MILSNKRRTLRDCVVVAFPAVMGAGSIAGAFDSAWNTWHAHRWAGTYFKSDWGILFGLLLLAMAVKTYELDLSAYALAVILLAVLFLGAAVELVLRPSFTFGGFVAGLAFALFNAIRGFRVQLTFRSQQAKEV